MSIPKKLKQAIDLTEAVKTGHEAFVIMAKLDSIETQIENIKPTDLTKIEDILNTLTEKVNEEIICELEII